MQSSAPAAPSAEAAVAALPAPRGTVTEQLFEVLRRPAGSRPPVWSAPSDEEDTQLALYCCYELHYRGFRDVPAEWEWDPDLLALRARLEQAVERQVWRLADAGAIEVDDVVPGLNELASDVGPSLSTWMSEYGRLLHLVELGKHRSAYQLKEADPHTWAIPRLGGVAKAAIVSIQHDEYGGGHEPAMHSSLFADAMAALGLDATPNRYLDELPACTLSTVNLVSFLGLHRRWRGALVGHLALFEMTSPAPMARYGDLVGRLGLGGSGRHFYDVHVEADERHRQVALDSMVAGLLADEPELAPDVLAGARALRESESRFTNHVLGSWAAGRSSLRPLSPGG